MIPAYRSSLRLEASEFLRIDNRTRAEKRSKEPKNTMPTGQMGAHTEYVPEPVFPGERWSRGGVKLVEVESHVDGSGGVCG